MSTAKMTTKSIEIFRLASITYPINEKRGVISKEVTIMRLQLAVRRRNLRLARSKNQKTTCVIHIFIHYNLYSIFAKNIPCFTTSQ
mmetsp:Transcript_68702/g.139795  ORF Transcript_68702/g.139795 Transcript_68702/m.139795 type:complete len:86 (-) Transcript_68702:2901-3158(-)